MVGREAVDGHAEQVQARHRRAVERVEDLLDLRQGQTARLDQARIRRTRSTWAGPYSDWVRVTGSPGASRDSRR
ncbi:hypothetical protein MTP03_15800 [Tsukamurella sp. PLM1]|nr:hypothetical protein MTP03_15800 [Tsukamurella sp. PLM1]